MINLVVEIRNLEPSVKGQPEEYRIVTGCTDCLMSEAVEIIGDIIAETEARCQSCGRGRDI